MWHINCQHKLGGHRGGSCSSVVVQAGGRQLDYSDHPLVLGPGFVPQDFDLEVNSTTS